MFSQILIAVVFCASLISKLRDPDGFSQAVADSGAVPTIWKTGIVALLVIAEGTVVVSLTLGLILATPWLAKTGSGLSIMLLTVYAAWLAFVRLRSPRLTCHCFGAGTVPVSWLDVTRNGLLAACASVGVVAAADRVRLPAVSTIAVGLVAVAGAGLMIRFVDVAKTLRASGNPD